MAELLRHNGKVSAPEWISALRAVPRHEFVPEFYEQHGVEWHRVSAESDPQRWWERVYSDVPLVTQLGTLPNCAFGPTSSSSAPGLMARMLEALDVEDHCSVCEIGTGTGYNAALLAHRLDAEQVFSVDIDADLVGTARERLRRLGWHPHLAVADGSGGWPHGGTFDRLIATCAVDRIPPAWLHQTSEAGLLLCDLKIGVSAGNLVALRKTGTAAEGRFVDGFASFMSLRDGKPVHQQHPRRDRGRARHRHTTMTEERPWACPVPWFLACLEMPGTVRFGYSPDENTGDPTTLFLSCPDGSWAEVSPAAAADGVRHVWEGGPSGMWSTVERARDFWSANGCPNWSRLGLTATAEHQRVWLDSPDGPSWVLHDRTRRRC